ncbi:MAG: ArsR family transcriptional regulator [Hyphomicrobiales bacterium]|nr:MAG: ArsR family transcriptional regulator [Hyphomicrobiales bacterium]
MDQIDLQILDLLQQDASLSQRQVAERVGLSQNVCWRRMNRLAADGIIEGQSARINRTALGLDLVVFVLVRTRNHSTTWLEEFRRHVESIPEITDFYRIGGDWDYLIRVVTTSMAGYDAVYQRLVAGVELETVTGLFAMEGILENRPIALRRTLPKRG